MVQREDGIECQNRFAGLDCSEKKVRIYSHKSEKASDWGSVAEYRLRKKEGCLLGCHSEDSSLHSLHSLALRTQLAEPAPQCWMQ